MKEEKLVFEDETGPKDNLTPKSILAKQMRWMKEEDFSNQVKASIKEVFHERYEWIVTADGKNPQRIIDLTKLCMESVKKNLLKMCIGKDQQEISKFIQKNRKDLARLLISGRRYQIQVNCSFKAITDAINDYAKDNDTELDLAIGGMIMDHLEAMREDDMAVFK